MPSGEAFTDRLSLTIHRPCALGLLKGNITISKLAALMSFLFLAVSSAWA
jgi:hypothetical protein